MFKLCILKRKSIRNVDEGMCEQIYAYERKQDDRMAQDLTLGKRLGALGEVFGLSGDIL